jgi:HAD superfamily phosphoserine phosphatase-like hydrolase
MRPIAVFDIDGTIFRSSLTIELFKHLVRRKIFPLSAIRQVERSEQKWLNRQGHYEDFVSDVVKSYYRSIAGKKRADIIAVSKEVVREQKHRVYRFTHDLLRKLRGKYFTIGISGSPLEVVKEYNEFLSFDKIYGTEIGIDQRGRYTGRVLHEPPRYKKELIVRYVKNHNLSFARSIGVGDTESDIGFLELVARPIVFNPNTKLAAIARRKNWPVVIERKDLIVKFKPNKVKYLKV